MAKDIRYYLKFDSNGRKVMRDLGVSTEELDRALEGLNRKGKESTGTLLNMASATVVIDGVTAAMSSLHAAMANLSAAYRVQQEAETKLETVMTQRMAATDAQIQSIKDLASAQQQLGIIGDEVQLAGAQQLATFLTTTDTLAQLIPAMNNLVAQQAGYSATSQNAVSVANLMGKAMQGQVSALSRVGITFSEAQAEILKYGNEAERAATLAQVITENVGQMNAALAATDTGKQKQLENSLGDIKEKIGQLATGAMPFLTFSNQAVMAAGNVMKLANGVKSATAAVRALHIQEKALAVVEKGREAFQKVRLSTMLLYRNGLKLLAKESIGATVAMKGLKVAMTGLLTGVGIGAAVTGLIYLLDKLTSSTNRAKEALATKSGEKVSSYMDMAKELEELKKDDGTPIHERYDRVKEFRDRLRKGVGKEIHDELKEGLKTGNISKERQTELTNRLASINQIISNATDFLNHIKGWADTSRKKAEQEAKANGVQMPDTKSNTPTDGDKHLVGMWNDPWKFRTLREFADAEKQLQDAAQVADAEMLQAIKEQIEILRKAKAAFEGGLTAAHLTAPRDLKRPAVAAPSLTFLMPDAKKIREKALDVNNFHMPRLAPAATADAEATESALDRITSAWSNIKGIKGGIDSMSKALDENASAWERLSGVIDGILQLLQGVASITEMINTLTGAGTALTQADAAAKMESAGAAGAEATAETAAAAAKTASAHAKIPFVGIGIAMASIAALVAMMTSLPKFAKGGLAYGPTLGLFGEYAGASNNPEVVAPLDRLRALIQPDVPRGELTTRITGRDIEVVYDYRKRKRSRI